MQEVEQRWGPDCWICSEDDPLQGYTQYGKFRYSGLENFKPLIEESLPYFTTARSFSLLLV